MDDPLMHDHDVIIDWDAVDLEIGRQWRENSSLEKWFPFTAEQLATLTAENAALQADKQQLGEYLAAAIDDRQDAYAAGFRRCAEWAKRDDLPHDVGSPAYLKDMASDLSVPIKAQLAAAEPEAERFATHIEALHQWTGCLSYNDSYVGEPEGHLKRHIRSLSKMLDQVRLERTAPPQHAAEPTKTRNYCCCGECGTAGYYDSTEPAEQHAARVPEMLTDDQRTALEVAVDLFGRCGNAFDELGAMTVIQDMLAAPTPPALEKASGFCDSCERTPHGIRLCSQCESNCRAAATPPAQEG